VTTAALMLAAAAVLLGVIFVVECSDRGRK